jgi:uncharacterized RDD family membrane protein YckC
MQTIRITTPQNIDIDYEIAGVGERVLARLIDYGIFILILIMGAIVGGISGGVNSELTIGVLVVIYAVLYVFYDLGCEVFMNGQSIGKRFMKIKVASLDGARPSVSQYLLRWLFRIVDFTLTSDLCALISVAVSDKSQRVGDMVAGTTLIKTSPRTVMHDIDFIAMADNYQPAFTQADQLSDKDISLIQDVVKNYFETGNRTLVHNAAARIKELLSAVPPAGMDDLLFLQTVVKDYSHIIAVSDQHLHS